ncbi:MAG: hypothetical protein IJ491_01960 [Clostridia bacterium]|nr:hypothetical protein [Clostridia bacterium]
MKTLIDTEFTVFPVSEKTNIILPFTVSEEATELVIDYSYSPKTLADNEKAERLIRENLLRDAGDSIGEYTDSGKFMPLKNLITLSLDSPSGYRGAAHRQDSEQHHVIRRNFASVGFLKGEIEKGQWQLVLNVHAVVTDEVKCKVRVHAGGVLK